jgi:hypothetical protein
MMIETTILVSGAGVAALGHAFRTIGPRAVAETSAQVTPMQAKYLTDRQHENGDHAKHDSNHAKHSSA